MYEIRNDDSMMFNWPSIHEDMMRDFIKTGPGKATWYKWHRAASRGKYPKKNQ